MVNAKGVPTLCLFGTNKLATIDPKTMEIKEYALPNAASRPRRIAIVRRRDLVRGFLARLSSAASTPRPASTRNGFRRAARIRSPTASSLPRARSGTTKSFAKPNTIVRFDPKTEKFQSWAIPGGGDIVRKMDVTPDGNPVTANSLTNQVGLVEVK